MLADMSKFARTRRLAALVLSPRVRAPAALILLALLVLAPASAAVALPGDLDPSFDLDGKKTFGSGGGDSADAVLVQPDGKLVVAGTGSPNSRLAASRLNPDGSFDGRFGEGGTAGADFGASDHGYAAALQSDGKIIVAGETIFSAGMSFDADFVVARFNLDGSLDQTFDAGGAEGNGKKKVGYGGAESGNALLLQRDGKIVIAGPGTANSDFTVTRLNPDGSPDTSFDKNGMSVADFGGVDSAEAAALQADGKIVVAGYTSVAGDIAIARFNPGGSLDDTFDGDGKKTLGGTDDDRAHAVLVQPEQKIVVAGFRGGDTALTRLNPDGSPDLSFDGDGTSLVDFGGIEETYATALQPNGKIVIAGLTVVNGVDSFAVGRLQPGGALDTTFSFDGKTTLKFGDDDTANAVALQRDGGIVVAGDTSLGRAVAMARLEGDAVPSGDTGGPGGAGGSVRSRCAGRRATIVGTAGRDVLRATRRADVIVALGGSDRVRVARGNDFVCGGAGNDTLAGGPGRDRMFGGSGRDRLSGNAGNDLLSGGPGTDRLLGQSGRDRLAGGGGRDNCAGGAGRDRARCEAERSA
jgi:uncharacterized delta-60 repeat protein